jgi:flagella basal body P-ring formation protein FlgA
MNWLAIALLLVWAVPAPAEQPPTIAEADPGLRLQIADWLHEHSPWPVTSVELPPLDGFALAEQPPDLEVELSTHPRQPLIGSVPVRVRLQGGGETLMEGVVTANVRAELPVVVAARDLRSGRPLAQRDLSVEVRDVSELPAGWLDDPSQAVGRSPRRPVRAGKALVPDSLDEVAPVRRGQRVKIRLTRGRLRIETVGLAREDGAVGDWIRVLNVASRREVIARVGEDGAVHVGY